MTFEEYQKSSYSNIAPHPDKRDEVLNQIIGLCEEVGEVASIIKHTCFHGQALSRGGLIEELGDVLWYTAAICSAFEIELDAVAQANVMKLAERFSNGYSDAAVAHRHDKEEV